MKTTVKKGQYRRSEFIKPLTDPPFPETHVPFAPEEPVGCQTRVGGVLVVDDNVDSAEALASLLKISGHDVRTAYSGQAALEAAAAYLPAVVLLDIGLPGINGYEVARRLRQIPELAAVRIVAMTGYGQDSDLKLAHEAGFDSHLTKPVEYARVLFLLAMLMVRPRQVGTDVTSQVSLGPVAREINDRSCRTEYR
jgi:CheY-like chemotaxis protein